MSLYRPGTCTSLGHNIFPQNPVLKYPFVFLPSSNRPIFTLIQTVHKITGPYTLDSTFFAGDGRKKIIKNLQFVLYSLAHHNTTNTNYTSSHLMKSDVLQSIIFICWIHTRSYTITVHTLTFVCLFSWLTTHCGCIFTARKQALASSFSRFLDNTRCATVGRAPLDE